MTQIYGPFTPLLRTTNPVSNADSVLSVVFGNPLREVLALSDSLALSSDQVTAAAALADSLDALMAVHRAAAEPVLDSLLAQRHAAAAPAGGQQGGAQQLVGRYQRELRPHVDAAASDAAAALTALRTVLAEAQWELLPAAVRRAAQPPAPRPAPPPNP
jgi:hypothetical protein